jgi:signal transduction histidine kinase/GAF domain-containing protein
MEVHTTAPEEFAIIERVARIVSSVRGTKPDYTRLAGELEQAIPFDVFGVVLLRHDRQAVRVAVCHRLPPDTGNSAWRNGASATEEMQEMRANPQSALSHALFPSTEQSEPAGKTRWAVVHRQHPLEESKLEQVLKAPMLTLKNYPAGLNGPPAVSGDALSGYPQLHSTLIVPLMVEARVLGALELGSVVTETYGNETRQRLASAVAHVLATAIEGAQLGGSDEIQNKQRKALKDVSSALTSKMDLTTILGQITTGIAQALNVASAIVVQDQRDGKLRMESSYGLSGNIDDLFERPLEGGDQCIIDYTLRHRQPSVSQDIAIDERFPLSKKLTTRLGIHSIATYPLVVGSTIYGMMILGSVESGGFTPLKLDILSLFAVQAAIAMHNGMLLEAAQQRSRFQELLQQLEHMGAEGGEIRDEYELLTRLREETQRTFGFSLTSLLRLISEQLQTHNERDQASMPLITATAEDTQPGEKVVNGIANVSSPQTVGPAAGARPPMAASPLTETLSFLEQMSEAALMRAGMLGELSRLLMQLKQTTSGVKDAWYVVDLNGACIYMNPAAETLSGMRTEDIEVSSLLSGEQVMHKGAEGVREEDYKGYTTTTIERVFASLLPRIRNAEEVRLYLQEFTQGNIYRQDLRCAVTAEPITAHTTFRYDASRQQADDPISLVPGSRRSSLRMESAASDYHYHLTRYPLHNQQERLVGNALQVRDVTEQVRDEKNRSALLSSVSHDLRTPLTTIKAAVTGLLQEDVVWEEQDRREMLQDIDAEADHLAVLVNALVEMSRIEMGALILEKEWCDITEVLHGALKKGGRVLAGHDVHSVIQAPLPLVYIDHIQIERVLINLLENAVERSPEHGVIKLCVDSVAAKLARGERATLARENERGEETESYKEPQVLRVRIADSGCDVPEQDRERIFKSFNSARIHDNGMKLAICKGIIEVHQGGIWVEACYDGKGACFVFTLPMHNFIAHSDNVAMRERDKPARWPGRREEAEVGGSRGSSW